MNPRLINFLKCGMRATLLSQLVFLGFNLERLPIVGGHEIDDFRALAIEALLQLVGQFPAAFNSLDRIDLIIVISVDAARLCEVLPLLRLVRGKRLNLVGRPDQVDITARGDHDIVSICETIRR